VLVNSVNKDFWKGVYLTHAEPGVNQVCKDQTPAGHRGFGKVVEAAEPYPNLFSKLKYTHKPC